LYSRYPLTDLLHAPRTEALQQALQQRLAEGESLYRLEVRVISQEKHILMLRDVVRVCADELSLTARLAPQYGSRSGRSSRPRPRSRSSYWPGSPPLRAQQLLARQQRPRASGRPPLAPLSPPSLAICPSSRARRSFFGTTRWFGPQCYISRNEGTSVLRLTHAAEMTIPSLRPSTSLA